MKKTVIMMSVVWLITFGKGHADIAIIAPNFDSNCDAYFDNQAQLYDHTWEDNKFPDVLAILVTYIKNYVSTRFSTTNKQVLDFESSKEENLHCYAVPKVIEADNRFFLHPIVLINHRLIGFKQDEPIKIKDNSAMCCFVSLQAQDQSITA
ncbi:hypothetical protein MCAMS1_01838 [biofilm metagenome]